MTNRTSFGASGYAWRIMVASLLLAFSATFAAAETRSLTLNDALMRAVRSDAAVAATRSRVRGAEAGIRQAGRSPNPSLNVDVENFGGSGPYRGSEQPETTAYFQQPFELGNKREARTAVARSELEAVRARGGARVLDLLRDVELAWVEVMVATAQLRVAEERLAIAQQFQNEVSRRSQSGRDPLFAQTRADAQVALDMIAVDQARANARTARAHLASYWRGNPDFEVDVSAFENVSSSRDGRTFNSDIALLEAERSAAAARIELERSRAVPDPALRLGVRHFNERGDAALVAGITIPLPLFDTNEDAIAKAQADKRAAEHDLEAARRALKRELTRLQSRRGANASEAQRIQTEVIPQAQRAVALVKEGVDRGAFTYLEYADAQRTLNDARLRRIEALKSFHQDNAAIARLTGRHTRLDVKVHRP